MNTEDNHPSTDDLREMLREELITENGAVAPWGGFHIDQIERLRFYLETLEAFISEQEAGEVKPLERHAVAWSEKRRSEFWTHHYPVHWDEIFRTTLRSSFLVSLISFTEDYLAQASRNVEVIAPMPFESSALRGNVFDKARLIFDAFGHFSQPVPAAWQILERIYDVRNVLVHRAGFLETYSYQERVRQFIRQQRGLSEEYGHISLGPEFCPFALEHVKAVLMAVGSELAALCERVRRVEGA